MGPVYVYLATWILGGVLLGSSMLLAEPKEAGLGELNAPLEGAPSARTSVLYPGALALVGFGLGGLAAEGLALLPDTSSWASAATGALLLGAAGFLTRNPSRSDS